MTMRLLRGWLDQAQTEQAFGETPMPPEELADASLLDLDGYVAGAIAQVAAARQVEKWIKTEMVARLAGRSARFGGWFYRVGRTVEYKVRADARRVFWDLVEKHGLVERLFNPNQARKGGMDELAKLYPVRADHETGEVLLGGAAAFTEDILEVVVKEGLQRQEVGSSYAPKFAQTMTDGEVR